MREYIYLFQYNDFCMKGFGTPGLSTNGLSRLILLQKYFHRIDFVVQHFWPSLSLPFFLQLHYLRFCTFLCLYKALFFQLMIAI